MAAMTRRVPGCGDDEQGQATAVQRRRRRHLRRLRGIILLRLFRLLLLVLRIVIAKTLPMKRKSGTAMENE
jgi:hypothetical protein